MSFLNFIFILFFKVHILKKYIYLSLVVMDLRCCACRFSLAVESEDYPLVTVLGLLIALASLVVEHGLQ